MNIGNIVSGWMSSLQNALLQTLMLMVTMQQLRIWLQKILGLFHPVARYQFISNLIFLIQYLQICRAKRQMQTMSSQTYMYSLPLSLSLSHSLCVYLYICLHQLHILKPWHYLIMLLGYSSSVFISLKLLEPHFQVLSKREQDALAATPTHPASLYGRFNLQLKNKC